MRRKAYIPRPGDQYRVVYLAGADRKHKDFMDLQTALDFYCAQGWQRASFWILTVSGNPKAQLILNEERTLECSTL